MPCRGKLIARATLRAYQDAIADGADIATAYRLACNIYRANHPNVREPVLRHVVSMIVSDDRRKTPGRAGASRRAGGRSNETSDRDVIAAQHAYVAAIARGVGAHVAFDVARAAYRAVHPELSGEALDYAVARALATELDAIATSNK
jgi:hypothetical protein